MRTQEQMRQILERVHINKVAREAGVSLNTLYKFKWGKTDMRMATAEKLDRYFNKLIASETPDES